MYFGDGDFRLRWISKNSERIVTTNSGTPSGRITLVDLPGVFASLDPRLYTFPASREGEEDGRKDTMATSEYFMPRASCSFRKVPFAGMTVVCGVFATGAGRRK